MPKSHPVSPTHPWHRSNKPGRRLCSQCQKLPAIWGEALCVQCSGTDIAINTHHRIVSGGGRLRKHQYGER